MAGNDSNYDTMAGNSWCVITSAMRSMTHKDNDVIDAIWREKTVKKQCSHSSEFETNFKHFISLYCSWCGKEFSTF